MGKADFFKTFELGPLKPPLVGRRVVGEGERERACCADEARLFGYLVHMKKAEISGWDFSLF